MRHKYDDVSVFEMMAGKSVDERNRMLDAMPEKLRLKYNLEIVEAMLRATLEQYKNARKAYRSCERHLRLVK
jgi:hypothetical protein